MEIRNIKSELFLRGQADDTTRVGHWSHRTFIEASPVTNTALNIYHEYQKTVTLTGAIEDFDLDIDYPHEIQRVNLLFNAEFEKSFVVEALAHESGNSNATIMGYSKHFNSSYESTEKRIFLYPRLIRISMTEDRPSIAHNTIELTVVTRELPVYKGHKVMIDLNPSKSNDINTENRMSTGITNSQASGCPNCKGRTNPIV